MESNSTKPKNNKIVSLLLKLVIIALIVYGVFTFVTVRTQIANAKEENSVYAAKVESLAAGNAEMEYDINHSNDRSTKEDIARSMGYIKPGETVYVDAEN